MFAISYLRDKQIYHSDWSIHHNTISITLMYLGDSEGRGSFLSLKNDSEARINVVFCPCSLLPNRGWSLWGKVVFNAISVTPVHLWNVVLQLPAYRLKLISWASRPAVGKCGVLPSPGAERSSFPGDEVQGPLGTLWGGGCGFGTTNLPKFKHQRRWDLEPLFTEPGGTGSLRCWPCPRVVKRAVGKCCPAFIAQVLGSCLA